MEKRQQRRSQNWTAPPTTTCKGRYSCTPLQQIRSLFLSGNHFFARQLNAWTGSNDARKCISTLRKQGMNIKDKWFDKIQPNAPHIKIYWLEMNEKKSLQSFEKSAGEKLPTENKKVQQNAIREPQRIDSIIINEWQRVMEQRTGRSFDFWKGGQHG